jgi:hypothetical protein
MSDDNTAVVCLSMEEVDFIRFAIDIQIQVARSHEDTLWGYHHDNEEAAQSMEQLSDRLEDCFPPVAWLEYHILVKEEDND